MNISENTAKRIIELFLNGTWIANTNYKLLLDKTDFKTAVFKKDGFNRIADLTYHIYYYLEGLNYAFEYKKLTIKDKYSFNTPELKEEKDWIELKQKCLNEAEKFAFTVSNMTESEIYADFILPQYGNCLRNIEAIIEHGYYHLGQMVLIHKIAIDKLHTVS